MTYICTLTTLDNLTGAARTYEAIKAAVIAAGRFSAFDIVTRRDQKIFTALARDPEIILTPLTYPVTRVEVVQHD